MKGKLQKASRYCWETAKNVFVWERIRDWKGGKSQKLGFSGGENENFIVLRRCQSIAGI